MRPIVYTYHNAAYLNITNKCCCACTFCIRGQMDGVGSADSLWLGGQPDQAEINEAVDAYDWSSVEEAVFCGFGEPTCELQLLLDTARYLRGKKPGLRIRLNTNGLSDLVNGPGSAQKLGQVLDAVSISLNAPTAEDYLAVTRPVFGAGSFQAMLDFAVDCKNYIPEVKMSIVDTIPEEQIRASQALAERLGVALRIRHFNEDSSENQQNN